MQTTGSKWLLISERTLQYAASECPSMCDFHDFDLQLSSSALTYNSLHTSLASAREDAILQSYNNSVSVKSRVTPEDIGKPSLDTAESNQ